MLLQVLSQLFSLPVFAPAIFPNDSVFLEIYGCILLTSTLLIATLSIILIYCVSIIQVKVV